MHLTRWSALAIVLLFLTACGGGGHGTAFIPPPTVVTPLPVQPPEPTPPTVMPDPDPGPVVSGTDDITLTDVQKTDPAATISAVSGAATSLPVFGSVTQSERIGSLAGISVEGTSTEFDGQDLAITIRRDDGSALTFGTARSDVVEPAGQVSAGGDAAGGWYFLNLSEDALSLAHANVVWDNSDPFSYLSLGYWLHFSGNLLSLDMIGGEIGGFVDGPELDLSAPPNMPITGMASYSGPAQGIFAAEHGTDTESPLGSTVIGEYFATISLTADFDASTIRGCIGCSGTLTLDGIYTDGVTGEESFHFDHEEVPTTLIHFGATSFGSDGTFSGTDVMLEDTTNDIPFTSSSGAWGGRFSNIPSVNGDPRSVAGTTGAEGETAGGSSVAFIGPYISGID